MPDSKSPKPELNDLKASWFIDPPDRYDSVHRQQDFIARMTVVEGLSGQERAACIEAAWRNLEWRLSHPLPGEEGYSPDLYDDEGEAD